MSSLEQAILSILKDDKLYIELLDWITSRTPCNSTYLKKLIAKYKSGTTNAFPVEIHNWISNLLQTITVSVRVVGSNPVDTTKLVLQSQPIKVIETPIAKSDMIHGGRQALTISDIPITIKSKNKKRINSSLVTISENTSTATPATTISVATTEAISINVMIAPNLNSCIAGGNHMSSIFSSSSIASNLSLTEKAGAEKSSASGLLLIHRLSTMYARLVLHQMVPFQIALSLLAKFASVPWISGESASFSASTSTPTIFSGYHEIAEFTARCLDLLSPVINRLGAPMINGFAACPVLQILAPQTQDAFLAAAEEEQEHALPITTDLFSMYSFETFIRPFREETDSRLEYTSQMETAVYNERERLYDSFTEFFNQFQTINKSDIDGSKINQFWQNDMAAFLSKISGMKECNMAWFADIFMKMLIFYGLNSSFRPSSSSSSSTSTSVSASQSSMTTSRQLFSETPSESLKPTAVCQDSPTSFGATKTFSSAASSAKPISVFHAYAAVSASVASAEKVLPTPLILPERSLPTTPSIGTISYGNNPSSSGSSNISSSKQRKLEERMGPGGTGGRLPGPMGNPGRVFHGHANYKGSGTLRSPNITTPQSDGFRSSPSVGSAKTEYHHFHKRIADSFEEPSHLFPGNQQFFFRLIVLFDNHRFSQNLYELICGEIAQLSSQAGRYVVNSNHIEPSSASTNIHRMGSADHSNCPSPSPLKAQNQLEMQQQSNEPIVLRILKLRLLGKFLGLLEFWSQWTLSIPITRSENMTKRSIGSSEMYSSLLDSNANGSHGGPLALQADERARYRSLLRKSLPLRQLIESAFVEKRLSVSVPWIVEFLKMMEWDRSMMIENPYKESLSLLVSIQRCDLFHPGKDSLTGNRLFVLLELQRLWESIPCDSFKPIPLPGGVSVLGLTTRLRSASNVSNSSSNYLTGNRISGTSTTASTALLSSSPSMHGLGIGAIDDLNSVFSPLAHSHLFPMLQDVCIQLNKLSSGTIDPQRVAGLDRDGYHLRSISETGMPMLTNSPCLSARRNHSLTSMQSDTTMMIRSHSTSATQLDNDVYGTPFRGSHTMPANLQLSMHNASPERLAASSLGESPGISPSNPITPRRQRSTGSIASMQTRLATTPVRQLSGNSLSSSISPNVVVDYSFASNSPPPLLPNHPINSGNVLAPQTTTSTETFQSEIAFWQQHPQLYQIHCFLVDQFQQACHAQLKEKIASAVRQLWVRIANLRQELSAVPSHAAVDTETLTDSMLQSMYSMGHQFQQRLQTVIETVHLELTEESKAFVSTFIDSHMANSQLEMFSLYPIHPRVSQLASFLMKKQIQSRYDSLLSFLETYARRKFEEVRKISLKQSVKSTAGLPAAVIMPAPGLTRCDSQDAGIVAPYALIELPNRYCLLMDRHLNDGQLQHLSRYIFDTIQIDLQASIANNNSDECNAGFHVARLKEIMHSFQHDLTDLSPYQCKSAGQVLVFTVGDIWRENIQFEPVLPSDYNSLQFRNMLLHASDKVSRLIRKTTQLILYAISWKYCSHQSTAAISDLFLKDSFFCKLLQDTNTSQLLANMNKILLSTVDAFKSCYSTFAGDIEMQGKVQIDVAKLFIGSLPSLVYLDFCVCQMTPSSIDGFQSDCILSAVHTGLISDGAFSRILTSSSRLTTASYYEGCYGYVCMKAIVEIYGLKLIGRYLQSKQHHGVSRGNSCHNATRDTSDDRQTIPPDIDQLLTEDTISGDIKSLISSLFGRIYK